MFLVKIIIWSSVFISILIGQKIELSSGFYQNSTKEDSIEVLVIDENKVDLKLSDGSKLRFNLESDIFKMKNLSNNGYTGLRLINDTKFEMFMIMIKKQQIQALILMRFIKSLEF